MRHVMLSLGLYRHAPSFNPYLCAHYSQIHFTGGENNMPVGKEWRVIAGQCFLSQETHGYWSLPSVTQLMMGYSALPVC